MDGFIALLHFIKLLNVCNKNMTIELNKLKPEERFAFENLIKRKEILKEEIIKIREVELTVLGKRIINKKLVPNCKLVYIVDREGDLL